MYIIIKLTLSLLLLQGKVTQRKVYFHIQDKQEVRVKEACTEEAAKLPRTVEPLYSGHHWDHVKLSVLSRCPVFREYSCTEGVAQNKLRIPGNDPYFMISTWTAVFRDHASFSES